MPRQKKVTLPVEPNIELTIDEKSDSVEPSPPPLEGLESTSIQLPKKKIREKKVIVKATLPSVKNKKEPLEQITVEPVQDELGDRILKLIDEKFKAYLPVSEPTKKEDDEIIVVKKKQPKRQPRKKVIYIDDPEQTVDDVVTFNHPNAQPQIQYW